MSATCLLPVDDEPGIDPSVDCARCEAICCRLTVVILPGDAVPDGLTIYDDHGLEMMARGEDGWCVALDLDTMRCGIYEQRPQICRKFAMGGPYCRAEREDWRGLAAEMASPQVIPILLR